VSRILVAAVTGRQQHPRREALRVKIELHCSVAGSEKDLQLMFAAGEGPLSGRNS